MENKLETKTCHDLLEEYKSKNYSPKGRFLKFNNKEIKLKGHFEPDSELTIYNPTKPFFDHGKKVILARVEPKHSEYSKVFLFEEAGKDEWSLTSENFVFEMQDPFFVGDIQGWKIVGGVRVFMGDNNYLDYETIFYRYRESIFELYQDGKMVEPFAKSPIKMKDIRLIDLKDGKIGVFTRPQGGEAGRGKIAYSEISNLDELDQAIIGAKIIPGLFSEDEWGGANDLYELNENQIGVFGHIAHFENKIKHYYSIIFVFDRRDFSISNLRIIAVADNFGKHDPKNESIGKVVFTGGAYFEENKVELYLGIGDSASGLLEMTNPFSNLAVL